MPSTPSSSRHRIAATAIAAALAASLGLAGCGTTSATPDSDPSGDGAVGITVFNGATGALTQNFNPFMAGTALQPTLGVIYEPLYWYNLADTSQPVPILATGYTWNDDGTVLTITVREGVTWHDGQPMTAADVAYTLNMGRKFPALNTGGYTLAQDAEAPDETTVVVTFTETSFMAGPVILGNTAIVPQHIWETIADPTKDANLEPVGTGPFKFQSFSTQSYTLTKNENYWEAGKPSIDTVTYISLNDASAAAASLINGDVDWMSTFMQDIEMIVAQNPDVSYVNTPALTTSLVTCSNADLGCSGPQTDPAVRQAIYHAMDRTQLNDLAGGGLAATCSPTLLLPDRDADWIANGADLTCPAGADADQANAILEAAGWTMGADGVREKDGQKLSLTVTTVSGWSDYISISDTLRQQLQPIGIDLQPSQLAWNEWNQNALSGSFQLTLDSLGLGMTSNPYYTYQQRYSSELATPVGENVPSNTSNTARYVNAAVDAALVAAAATDDEAAQKEQYAIIEENIVNDLPYIPIYINSTLTEFNDATVTGWPTNDDKYAYAAAWKSWDSGIVLKTIVPAQ
ncbi:MAG: ABC transporter substrate-binding protein [Propionibacteriaceae bacterium]|jgi:peptide/nickel transport system substrate-binding protein|nr:ABC transporter substrate-binding protein [Propionibacteriaceae bacterium]